MSRTDGAGAPIESVPGQRMSASSGAYSVADMLRDAMDAMCVGEERTRIPVPTSLRPDPVGGRGGANRWGGWGRSERSWGLDREVQEGGMSRSGDEARALGPPQGQLGKFTAVDIVVGDPSSSSDEESSGLGDGMHEVGAFADRDGPILAGEGSASGSRPGFGSETEVSFSGVMETPGTSEKESVSGCRSRDRGGGKWGTDMWSKGGGCRAKEASERAHVGTEGEGASPGKVFVGLCARLEALAKQALEEPSTSKGETWDEVGASTAEASEGQAQSSPAKTQLLALYNACGVRECLEAWREASRHKGTMSGGNVGRRARHCGGSAEATTRGIAGEEGSTEAGIKRMEQAAVDEAKSPPVVDGRKATAASLSTGRDAWTASSGGRGHRGWPALLLGTGAQR